MNVTSVTKTAKQLEGKFVVVYFIDHWSSRLEPLEILDAMILTNKRAQLPRSFTCGVLYGQTQNFIFVINTHMQSDGRILGISGADTQIERDVDYWAILKSTITHIIQLKVDEPKISESLRLLQLPEHKGHTAKEKAPRTRRLERHEA